MGYSFFIENQRPNPYLLHNAIFLRVLFRKTTGDINDSNNYKTNNKQSIRDINSDFRLYSYLVATFYCNSPLTEGHCAATATTTTTGATTSSCCCVCIIGRICWSW